LAFGDAFWSNDAAIRLSLLLSAPNTPYHDNDQAARLLRDVIDREGALGSARADLAALLHHLLSERVYAESDDEMLAALLSEARDRNEQLNDELDALRAELDEERERSETLQEQIDALKRLEEQLSLERFEHP
jgi:septal ring factor EnvC (AmiA/AmiB activator)